MEEVTVSVSDETARALRESVNHQKDSLARQKARLRRGPQKGRDTAELSEHDVSTEESVKFAIQYMASEN